MNLRPVYWLLLGACQTSGIAATSSLQRRDASTDPGPPGFTLFESGQVRPLALSEDGRRLFAANTPDNRLEVFAVLEGGGLRHVSSIGVGLEPVALATRRDQVWVVNHLSDSVSVVALDDDGNGRVIDTLNVGDEPRDIVFAGPSRSRAFVTAAHRGQNVPFDPQLTTPGIGRADVWVFDVQRRAQTNIITLFADTPRALAVTPDARHVYAAAFHSGNRTATVNEQRILPRDLPPPLTNYEGMHYPFTAAFNDPIGLIVKFDGLHWVDELGRVWDDSIRFSLPDKDVFVIDAMQDPPRATGTSYSGVGTILFNMIVHPSNGKVYVSNTEAFNEVRFEGPGDFTGHPGVRGRLHESRLTLLDEGQVSPRHLNKHIDYSACCAPVPNAENERSLAFPQGMAFSNNGETLYVAALGSSKIGVFRTSALEDDTFQPSAGDHIEVTGGGPTAVVLDPSGRRLYALTRFNNAISIIDTAARRELTQVPMHNPEPASVVNGRRFLYDARHTSSHGDSACASCHVFGDFDSLAWDLGNPDAATAPFANPMRNPPFFGDNVFNALKGPMTTQSLRGMANHGPMHWRGDRTGALDEPSAQPDGGAFDEDLAFKKFNPAFQSLLGRADPLSDGEMQAFTDFILQIVYPPNPIRALDNSLTASQQAGRDFFFGPPSLVATGLNCNDCHVLAPQANPDAFAPGFFGTDGQNSFTFQNQFFKTPHLRNQYQKVGMFGFPEGPAAINLGHNEFMGDQVRGFGFFHDGSNDTVFRFLNAVTFNENPFANPGGIPVSPEGDIVRRNLEAFMLAFDSNLAPVVGQQVTLASATADARLELLISRANAGECDLVAKSGSGSSEMGYAYDGAGSFVPNRSASPLLSDAALRALSRAQGLDLTYTCAPLGSGVRMALDRDGDGWLDGDELDRGSDPANSSSH